MGDCLALHHAKSSCLAPTIRCSLFSALSRPFKMIAPIVFGLGLLSFVSADAPPIAPPAVACTTIKSGILTAMVREHDNTPGSVDEFGLSADNTLTFEVAPVKADFQNCEPNNFEGNGGGIKEGS